MSKLRFVIVRLALVGIALVVLATLVLWFAPLEFKEAQVEAMFYRWLCYCVSACIWLLLVARLRFDKSAWINVGQALVAGLIPAFLIGLQALFSLFVGMCGWVEYKTLFTGRVDPSHRIVVRYFGCGAWDGDRPAYEIYEMKNAGEWFICAARVDTASIDKGEWERPSQR